MRILVVCGAGASSTFVAQRVRHAAHDAGMECTALAGTEASLPIDLDSADLVLVGPHLSTSLDEIRHAAEQRGAGVALLPDDVFSDTDGSRTLRIVREAMDLPPSGLPAPAPSAAADTPPPGTEPPSSSTVRRDPS